MKDNMIRTAVCPLCGRTYHGAPALSGEDNKRSSAQTVGQGRRSSQSVWSHLSRNH